MGGGVGRDLTVAKTGLPGGLCEWGCIVAVGEGCWLLPFSRSASDRWTAADDWWEFLSNSLASDLGGCALG